PPKLVKNPAGRRLRATSALAAAVRATEITIVAVGTPFQGDQIDLTFVRQCAAEIGKALAGKKGYHVVVVKSRGVPGTTDDVVRPILERESGRRAGADFGVGMNPESLSEGEA